VDGPGHGPRDWHDLPPEQLEAIIAALRAEGRAHQAEADQALRLADRLEAQLVAARQADRRRRKAAILARMRELGLAAAIGAGIGAAVRAARCNPALAAAVSAGVAVPAAGLVVIASPVHVAVMERGGHAEPQPARTVYASAPAAPRFTVTASPSAAASPTPTPSPTGTSTATPTPTPTPTGTPSPVPTAPTTAPTTAPPGGNNGDGGSGGGGGGSAPTAPDADPTPRRPDSSHRHGPGHVPGPPVVPPTGAPAHAQGVCGRGRVTVRSAPVIVGGRVVVGRGARGRN